MLCAIWHHLYNSKNAITFSKVAVQFFLNCANGTKSSNTSHLNSFLSKFKSKTNKELKASGIEVEITKLNVSLEEVLFAKTEYIKFSKLDDKMER